MNEQTWIDSRVDRSKWPAGEWDGEPDKVQWTDADTGLVCLAKRNSRSGNWCGYVGVSDAHPWHGKGYNDLPEYGPEVHGGLTFANSCQEGPPEQTICHIPAPGTPDHLWWFGFDCAHAWDYSPMDKVLEAERGYPFTVGHDETYKPLGYVKRECTSLARQIAAASAESESGEAQ
jgi:hypothetical protein